jgi:hypothetical protein
VTDRPRKKKAGPSLPTKQGPPAAKPGAPAKRLVVHFRREGDPSPAQTEAVHSAVKKLAHKAAVKGEFPGALNIEVAPESEEELRDSIKDLNDWDVGVEGTAQMPPKPIPEE